MGNIHGLLQSNLVEAAHVPDAAGRVFQHCVNVGSELRRVNGRFLPFLCPQAVFEEIG